VLLRSVVAWLPLGVPLAALGRAADAQAVGQQHVSDLEAFAYGLFVVSIVLRMTCGRFVKRGSKYAPDAEFHPPLASRWIGEMGAAAGAVLGIACLLVSAGLMLYSCDLS
jgi:hypothetical protein